MNKKLIVIIIVLFSIFILSGCNNEVEVCKDGEKYYKHYTSPYFPSYILIPKLNKNNKIENCKN